MPQRLEKVQGLARQIAVAGLPWGARQNQSKALLFSGGLYGVEVQAATLGHVEGLRRAVSYALWKTKGPRNRLATLLLLKMDPWVAMCQRIMMHWWRQATAGFFDEFWAEYWEMCKQAGDRVRGPAHQAVRLSVRLGLRIDQGRDIWAADGRQKTGKC